MNSYEQLEYTMCSYCSLEVPKWMIEGGNCKQCRDWLEEEEKNG